MRTLQRIALSLALITLTPALMNAQVDRSKAPSPSAAPHVRLGTSKTFTLDNGMRVITVENHKLPVVSVQLRFDNPPIRQGDIAGYQDMVGELLTAGTAQHSKQQLDEIVDGMGAQLNGSSDGVFASSLKKNFPKLMELVYEVTTAATFPPAEFEKVRTRALSGVKSRMDDPDQIGDVVGRALTYGTQHPYGEVVTETTLGKIKRENVYTYYQRFFRPEKGYLVFVGDISEGEAKGIAERLFGTWKGASVATTTAANGQEEVKDLGPIIPAETVPAPSAARQVCFVDRPGSAQSVVKVLFPVDMKPNDKMALSAQVMNTILGGGVFNARLMQNLREARGFTYGAYSSLDADRWCGSFSAGCSVRNEVTDSAITELMFEIEHMREAPVTDAELSLAKSYMAGSFARSLEDPRTIARFALNTFLNDLPADHYSTYLQRLEAITAEDVLQAAKRLLLPDNAYILVVGDKAQVANRLAPLSYTRAVVYYDTNGELYHEASMEDPPAGMTGSDVLEAYLKAIGGRKAIETVNSVHKEYTATLQGMPITLTEDQQAPNKYAMTLGNGTMVLQHIVFDGAQGVSGGVEGNKALGEEELESTRESAYAVPEAHYAQLDMKATLNGVVEVDGRKAYRLLLQSAGGRTLSDYYDVASGFKVRRVEVQASEEGTFQVTTNYSDYKAVKGILFPHTIAQNAGMDFTFTARSIVVDQPVDPAVFKVP